nr:DNA-(apurinic or apyrimidinic site) lyase-like [Ciona intestinalis]|eukprot:XP_002123983.3 DNA-(apurinic or apyrimidinic site) lyase-like [Ciona intestinalis]
MIKVFQVKIKSFHFNFVIKRFCVMAPTRASLKREMAEAENVVEKKKAKEENGNGEKATEKREEENKVVEKKLETKDGRQFNLKISSWNVAGVRAWVKKDGVKWVKGESPDIFTLQETKCSEKDIPQELKDLKEYHMSWNVAKSTKGFSGVGLFSKVKPLEVKFGIGVEEHDQEGRTITAEYDKFYLVSTYVPNAQRGLKRLEYRLKWNSDFLAYIKSLDEKKPVVLCGDMNVSHHEIDLANPKGNKKNAGFSQEERDGMTELLQSGFTDTYRDLYPDLTGQYTFWTYMGNCRAKNVGWRLDYFILSNKWKDNVCDNIIETSAMGSDHCPITLLLAVP